MMPRYSCSAPGQEAGHILEDDQREIEGVAEPDEAGGLDAGIDVERAGQDLGWLATIPTERPSNPSEADQDVAGMRGLQLEEVAVVQHLGQDLVHVVRLVALRRNRGLSANRMTATGRRQGRHRRRSSRLLDGR